MTDIVDPTVCFQVSDGTPVVIMPTKPLTSATIADLLEYLAVYRAVLTKRDESARETP